MIKIIGLSGSLRLHSYNTALLRTAATLVPADVTLTVNTINGIPLFNEDVEAQGYPVAVQELKELIASADGLLLATPEYNNSIPGVLKNTIDWLSRPGDDIPRIFGNKPVALMGASLGGFGTILGQNTWLSCLRALGVNPWTGGRMLVSRASNSFDADWVLTDAALREQLHGFLAGFARFIADGKIARTK
jgi:NAD(P)H-dependent FMN reductase